MKTTVFLVNIPLKKEYSEKTDTEVLEKVKKRFLAEKIYSVYSYPDAYCEKCAEYTLGSRGFNVIIENSMKETDTPDKAKEKLRSLIGLNLGKIIVVFSHADFINNILKALDSNDVVTNDFSVTTVIFTWEKTMVAKSVNSTEHLH